MGELVNATKTLARGMCIDVQRTAVRERRRSRSLDRGWDADADDRPFTAWEADEAMSRYERDEQDADADAFLRWALPQLRGRRRDVVERTFYGAELHEICDELGLTPDNAYQLRSRGLKDLAKLKEAYES
jgi:DNA-directed RNA polymerase specialized sigma subunit